MYDEVVSAVQNDVEAVNRQWQDPENLSAIGLRLALNFEKLGDLVTESESIMDAAKSDYDHHIDTRTLELVKTMDNDTGKLYGAGVAKQMAEAEYHEEWVAYLETKRKYGRVQRKRQAVEKIMDQVRSRVSLIKGDIRNA